MKNGKTRLVPRILANAGIVLGALYITLYILNSRNVASTFLNRYSTPSASIISRYLDLIIAGALIVVSVMYLVETWKRTNKAIRKRKEEKQAR